MNFISKVQRITLAAMIVIGAVACSDDDDNGNVIDNELTIVETAQGNAELSILVQALTDAGLVATLNDNGANYTVFAPTNAAFETYLNGQELEDLDDDDLRELLLNHVVVGEILSSEFTTGYISSLSVNEDDQNLSLSVDADSEIKINNDASIVDGLANIQASNGVVHVVDGVIERLNIVDHVTINPNFSSLVTALTLNDNETFTDLLSDGTYTVLAPTNDAFISFFDDDGDDDIDSFDDIENGDLTTLLSNHVIGESSLLSTDLSTSYTSTLAENFDGDSISLYINTDDGVQFNGISSVITPDVVATNGVIHAVNAVVNVPDVVTFVTADPTFSTLANALTNLTPDTDYVDLLNNREGVDDLSPYTVFAPTNDSFDNLIDDLDVDDLSDVDTNLLEATLNLHVLTDLNVRSEDLDDLDGDSVPTYAGSSITIDADAPAVIDPDGDSNPIIATDIQSINGVIHVVSRVLRDLD